MFAFQTVLGQKAINKTYPASLDTRIQIDTDKCYLAEISAYEGEAVIVEARMDGEYAEALSINITEEGKTLWIGTAFNPDFVFPNDKLSAHKVVSISLSIRIPAYRDVQVFGSSCNVMLSGAFNEVDVVLNDGSCTLDQVARNVKVNTQSGHIRLNSLQGAVKAISHYGRVLQEEIPQGEKRYDLETVSGDITLQRTR
ncbi:MAG: DUF4097 domain-containing protein [Eudoraea sp.]|nr:DUF4097 domain-containing protein [Eudoraea sp.]MBT8322016.1 DUF4097 domain-containing protein [Eudoraea sp.]NNJ40696.1 DUF4097 family beta strand repeat protein [Eudoraea sp.]